MKNKTTHYQLILDQSGSMQDIIEPTITGYNEQVQVIEDLAKKFPEQKITFSLITFNNDVRVIRDFESNGCFNYLDKEEYSPRGSTALLDAIGTTIDRVKENFDSEIKNDLATVVIVVLTDGHENASKIFTYSQLKVQIAELEKQGNWTFNFIGASYDVRNVVKNLCINQQNFISYNKKDTSKIFAKLAMRMEAYIASKEKGIKKNDFLK